MGLADVDVGDDQVERLKTEIVGVRSELRRQRSITAKTIEELDRTLGVMEAANSIPEEFRQPAKWATQSPRKRTVHPVIPVLMLSDLHLDEVVRPEQVNGLNTYNRAIAEDRLRTVIANCGRLFSEQYTGLTAEGIVCCLGGDIITGDIHDELAQTNEAPVTATIVHWVPLLVEALKSLADQFGKVHVPTVVGNHDRTGRKISYKNRAEASFAHIIYKWIAAACQDDDRITFQIGLSEVNYFDVYNTRFALAHGDGFRSSGGVGGIYPSLRKYVARHYALRPFDMLLCGHWHSTAWDERASISGSLKGYDEYAMGHGFSHERPQHSLMVVTPDNGISLKTTVFAD